MFWIIANDCACVKVSQYQSALQSNNIVNFPHAYSNQFQLMTVSSIRNESKILTPYVSFDLQYLSYAY